MKNKANILAIIAILLFECTLFAGSVDNKKAEKVAVNWYRQYAPLAKKGALISKTQPYQYNNRDCFYIFSFDQGGFVLVSANDATTPVLGYGFEFGVPEEITNEAVKGWFDQYARQIDTAFVLDIQSDAMSNKWNQILTNSFPETTSNSVGPLLTTTWDQGWPYNANCPVDPNGSGGHTWAGCTATAMSQILNFWNYPDRGVGFKTYIPKNHPQLGYVSAWFNTQGYIWTSMPNQIVNTNFQVSTLIFHSGVSAYMDYGSDGSGAKLSWAMEGFKKHFDYHDSIKYLYRSSFNDTVWNSMLKSELDSNRPVLYEGYGGVGHAFVIDGYQNNVYFSINWGWSGSANGYWQLNALTPYWFNFNSSQGALMFIYPNYSSLLSGQEYIQDSLLKYQFMDYSKGNPTTWVWNFGDGQLSYDQNPIHLFDTIGTYNISHIVCDTNICDTSSTILNITNLSFVHNFNSFGGVEGSNQAILDIDDEMIWIF